MGLVLQYRALKSGLEKCKKGHILEKICPYIRFCMIFPFLRAWEGTKNIPLLGDIFCTMHSTCIVYTLRKWGVRSCQSILCNSGITKLRHSSEMRI